MLLVQVAEDPEASAKQIGVDEDAMLVATRDPTAAETTAAKVVALVSAFAYDSLDQDAASDLVALATLFAARFDEFMGDYES